MALVRAKITHTQPGAYAYRTQGEEFEYTGKLYKHVELVKEPVKAKPAKDEEEIEEKTGPAK
jgi:hypothetical protein